MTNKTQEVLRHLQENRNITSLEAIRLYGATRLSAIIFILRKRGYRIINKREEAIDRYGNECRYVRYIYLGRAVIEEKKNDCKCFDRGFFSSLWNFWR